MSTTALCPQCGATGTAPCSLPRCGWKPAILTSVTDENAMSTTTTVPIIGAPNATNGAPTTPADQAAGLARDIPDLISKASTFDPDLAAKWTGQALIASRTPWGTLACSAVAWGAAQYGLACTATVTTQCWSIDTINLLGGAAAMVGAVVGAYLMRLVTESPITGIFRKATVAEAIAKLPTQGTQSS